MLSIAEGDSKISNLVLKDYVSSIDRKPKMDQENKSEAQIRKYMYSPKCRKKKQEMFAHLNQFCQLLQKMIRK